MHQHRKFCSIGVAAWVVFASSGAVAQSSGDVIFNGLILDSCVVAVLASGTLTADPTYMTLSSENAGGARGAATIVTTSTNFDLQIDTPTGFSVMPAGGDASVTYGAVVSTTGVTILADIADGVLSALGLGLTTLSVGTTATKGSGVFPAGSYQLPVTVRCVAS